MNCRVSLLPVPWLLLDPFSCRKEASPSLTPVPPRAEELVSECTICPSLQQPKELDDQPVPVSSVSSEVSQEGGEGGGGACHSCPIETPSEAKENKPDNLPAVSDSGHTRELAQPAETSPKHDSSPPKPTTFPVTSPPSPVIQSIADTPTSIPLSSSSTSSSHPQSRGPRLSLPDDWASNDDAVTTGTTPLTPVERLQLRFFKHTKNPSSTSSPVSQLAAVKEGGKEKAPLVTEKTMSQLAGKPGKTNTVCIYTCVYIHAVCM